MSSAWRMFRRVLDRYPSRIDEEGINWYECNFETMNRTVCNVVHAQVTARVSMLFLDSWTHHGLIILAKLLPRNILREIWRLHAPESDGLCALISRYIGLKRINGMYFRAIAGAQFADQHNIHQKGQRILSIDV